MKMKNIMRFFAALMMAAASGEVLAQDQAAIDAAIEKGIAWLRSKNVGEHTHSWVNGDKIAMRQFLICGGRIEDEPYRHSRNIQENGGKS